MGDAGLRIQGMAYLPGTAAGTVRHGLAGGSGHVAVVDHRELGAFAAPPEAVVIVEGAPFSHTTIGLRSLGVPMVLVSESRAAALEEGASVAVDGTTGLIEWPLPPARTQAPPPAGPGLCTADGVPVSLLASVHAACGAGAAARNGAAGIGLVRTEFLVPPAGRLPDRDYFEGEFTSLCGAAAPLPVTFRLIDIAADKIPAWMPAAHGIGDALGLQGARLYDHEMLRPVVEAQLAALSALAGGFEVSVLLPFMARHEELRRWAGFVRERLPAQVPVGAMVETPLAALDLGSWLDTAGFVAIGCNDLMQCLFVADRDRPELRDHLDPYAPPLFRFLQQVAAAAGRRLAHVRLCGLLSQLPGILPVLLGMGYRAFSVDPPSIPYLARSVQSVRVADATLLADRVCWCAGSQETRSLLGVAGTEMPA